MTDKQYKKIQKLRWKYSALWEEKWKLQREQDRVWAQFRDRIQRMDGRISAAGMKLQAAIDGVHSS